MTLICEIAKTEGKSKDGQIERLMPFVKMRHSITGRAHGGKRSNACISILPSLGIVVISHTIERSKQEPSGRRDAVGLT